MEREALFTTMAAAFFAVVVLGLAIAAHRSGVDRGPRSQARAGWALLVPLLGGVLVLAFLLGWVLQEPDPADEWASPLLIVLAAGAFLIAARASWRALCSLRRAAESAFPIATVGLFHPRCLLSGSFRRAASGPVLRAAWAHEAAHARHRDPLRIWLAQWMADLQWPIPSARTRFHAWLLALELDRDAEAVGAGASALDLAEAMVLAARLTREGGELASAAPLVRGRVELTLRVHRLLDFDGAPLPKVSSRGRGRRAAVFALYLLVALGLGWLGSRHGDEFLKLLPGVWV